MRGMKAVSKTSVVYISRYYKALYMLFLSSQQGTLLLASVIHYFPSLMVIFKYYAKVHKTCVVYLAKDE